MYKPNEYADPMKPARRFFVQVSNLGDLPCTKVVASLELVWPGLGGLAERSRLGTFTAVPGQKLTATSISGNYSLIGSLAGGQVITAVYVENFVI